MPYRYQWEWKWHAWQRFTKLDPAKVQEDIAKKIRGNLLTKPTITGIESITHNNITTKHEYVMGIYHSHVYGTTTTIFTSTEPSASPIAPIILAAVVIVIGVIIAFALWQLATISSNVKEVLETTGGQILALGLGAVLVVGALLLLPKAVPAVKKVAPEVKKAVGELHPR